MEWNLDPANPSTKFERIDNVRCHQFLDLALKWECVGVCMPNFAGKIIRILDSYWYSTSLRAILKMQRAVRLFLQATSRYSNKMFWSHIVRGQYIISSYALPSDRFVLIVESLRVSSDCWKHLNNSSHLINKQTLEAIELADCHSAAAIGQAIQSYVL